MKVYLLDDTKQVILLLYRGRRLMERMLESEGQVYATLKLQASKEDISMIKNAIDIELDSWSEDTLYFSKKNIEEIKFTIFRILRIWSEIEKTGESYLYIINPKKKSIILAENDIIEALELDSIRAKKIFLEHFSAEIEDISILS
jgi:hypothetical protein